MDSKLYVERWLLMIKAALAKAGLTAHVRAVGFKGGPIVALEVHQGPGALELRYRKRRLGVRVAAAATSREILAPVRRVFEKVLAEHPKLLENGLRRFLRTSLGAVHALEKSFAKDPAVLGRIAVAMGKHAPVLRPALALQPAKRGRFVAHPAIARRQGSTFDFFAWNMHRLFDLSMLLPTKGGAAPLAAIESSIPIVVPPLHREVELVAAGGDPSIGGGDWEGGAEQVPATSPRHQGREIVADVATEASAEAAGAALEGLMSPREAASGFADVGVAAPGLSELSAAADLAEAGGAAVDALGTGLEGLANATDALAGLADAGGAAAESAAGAVEAVSGAASCLEGADCSGVDLGGLDCNFG